ncbi:MAG TPA: hypothetical protein VIW64_12640, partial [Pyrinomonadaceae bacterium]
AVRDYQFRALRGVVGVQDYLFLSWVVRVSTLNAMIMDRVNCVLGAGGNYLAFQINLATGSGPIVAGTENAPDSAFTYRMHSCDVSGANLVAHTPDLAGTVIENTGRMWVAIGQNDSPGRHIPTLWAFQIAIPLGSVWTGTSLTLPASGDFKLWYEVWTSMGGGATVSYRVPNAGTATDSSGADIIPAAGPPLAQLLDMSTNFGGGCTTAVTLEYMNAGTRNVNNATDPPRTDIDTIRLDLGQPYPPLQMSPYDESYTPNVASTQFQNQFFAQPTFPGGYTDAQKTSVRADFSLANWGSQYQDPTANSWSRIPGGTGVQYQVGGINEMRFIWPQPVMGSADAYTTTLVRNINKFLNALRTGTPPAAPAQNAHQCMLIELSSSDSSVVMTTSSIYRNMNIARASEFRRFAEISVAGIPPISPQKRDVYLYLLTSNMPPVVKRDGGNGDSPNLKSMETTFSRAGAVGKGNMPSEVEDIANIYPTYSVHAYHDTGKKMTLSDGRKIAILEPQTAFGYFVTHEGDLYGWETRLYGAEKLAENLYIVRVPNNRSVYVETAIQARATASEPPLPDDKTPPKGGGGGGCLAALLGIFKKKP